jgi:hypothetical protein
MSPRPEPRVTRSGAVRRYRAEVSLRWLSALTPGAPVAFQRTVPVTSAVPLVT